MIPTPSLWNTDTSKYKTFFIFLFLTAIWSSFFSTFKYFLWGDANVLLHDIKLDVLAWYLSLGWVFAYIIGWAIVTTFLKKYLLFITSLTALIFVCMSYFFNIHTELFLWFIVTSIWFLYWLWSIIKNIIIAIEIEKTGLADTQVNAYVGIVFLVSLIVWSISGSLLFENFWHNWHFILMGILLLSSVVSFHLDYDNIRFSSLITGWFKKYFLQRKGKFSQSLADYFIQLKDVIKNYSIIMFASSLFWAISTVVSQKAVEFSKDNFDMLASQATVLLLYSAIWAIIWTLLSIKMQKKRWFYFLFSSLFFSFIVLFFPFFTQSYFTISLVAFFIWLFFGSASNLIDSFFFYRIGKENKKEYGSSTYGLILSITIFVIMFMSSFLEKKFWFNILMNTLWIILFFTTIITFISQKNNS